MTGGRRPTGGSRSIGRFPEGIALTVAAGVDVPRPLLEMTLGVEAPVRLGQFEENV
jgi:hypothetical protein